MRFFSVCSGIEAASVAWSPLGWTAVAFSEIEKFPAAVLTHHYPLTPNLGNMTKLEEKERYGTTEFDLLVGGTPCQSFSIAGLRKGLDDERGQLLFAYCRILAQKRPRWMVWENVPGVLSSNGGRDFGVFLGALVYLGYGFAYRILDAQYFGVPQRRRRVFVVGHFGDWRRAAAVLFEQKSLYRHFAKSQKTQKEIAGTISTSSFTGGSGGRSEGASGNHFITAGTLCSRSGKSMSVQDCEQGHVITWPAKTACTLNASFGDKQGIEDQHINQGAPLFVPTCIQGNMVRPNAGCNGKGWNQDNVSYTLTSGDRHAVYVGNAEGGALAAPFLTRQNIGSAGISNQTPLIKQSMRVRRLTPLECERLQGFPDNYTQIPWRGKPSEQCPDGPRYKALGNSMAVPVMRWIGQRITTVDALALGLSEAA